MLVSDCIYSLTDSTNTQGGLELQKSLTKAAFLEEKTRKLFIPAVQVLQLSSGFTGKYYSYNNAKKWLDHEMRPYYVWLMGEDSVVKALSARIDWKKLKNYHGSCFVSAANHVDEPFYSVMAETDRVGKFESTDRNQREIKSIESLEFENGKLQFSVAIDLSKLNIDSTYWYDKSNYVLSEGYTLVDIKPVRRSALKPRDYQIIGKTSATHLFVISTQSNATPSDLDLMLYARLPAWIDSCSTTDDRDISLNMNTWM